MDGMHLVPGDVVSMTSASRVVYDETGKRVATFSFKSPKGEAFAFVFLGSFPTNMSIDPNEVLERAGWKRPKAADA